jgi:hypothetical protein
LKNKITAVNNLAVPVLAYSFGIDSWLRKEIEKSDQKNKKASNYGRNPPT